jgi:hypothetical protein
VSAPAVASCAPADGGSKRRFRPVSPNDRGYCLRFSINLRKQFAALEYVRSSSADRHGAVGVPVGNIEAMAAALDGPMKREAKIIAAARAPGAAAESIKAAMKG